MLEHALELARRGFYVFPIVAGQKKPPTVKGWQQLATRDEWTIEAWWSTPDNCDLNIGISTSKFGENEALLVVDVDNKGEKRGDRDLLRLELDGCELVPTFTQSTPSGGQHYVYRVPAAVRQGAGVLGPSIDIRSRGGYIVAAGSVVAAGEYRRNDAPIAPAPAWLIERCGRDARDERLQPAHDRPAIPVDPARALGRGQHYLSHDAPLAVEGQAGDETTYRVAARVKDLGVAEDDCTKLMWDHWNGRCSPPWSASDLAIKVHNAYAYGREVQGAAAPEADFADAVPQPGNGDGVINAGSGNGADRKSDLPPPAVLHPFDKLNTEYAFVLAGGGHHVLWETTDAQGRYRLEHLAMAAFHAKHAAEEIQVGKKSAPVTEEWMRWKGRRGYDGLVFMPEQEAPNRFYNLWRGFAYEPGNRGGRHAAVDAFLEHARSNVCKGDAALFRWLCGYFAHLVQRPWEKPLVALVFRGAKGVGKNALVERVGALLGSHFLLTSNRRYLVGNFNGHLENCLLFALDEAFWSGDKQAEGTLKDLITGGQHVIEHKGKEPYTVANKTRIVIIGNEDWLVPASHDERRFAVFDVGDGRKQDRHFFEDMRVRLESGGYRHLLGYLRDYDIAGIDVNEAPRTEALAEQKHHSLDLVHQWWLECLEEGRVSNSDLGEGWQREVNCETFRTAFARYAKDRRAGKWLPDSRSIGRIMKKCLPTIFHKKTRNGYVYAMPVLEEARAAWCKFIGHDRTWE
jgi:hypothetical protein